ncbi:glycosyl hydrolase family 71-domain-containing protein [Gymnopilus junonius]|uniref:Glycosyl hydrolase family 71-domain-containing protein n=1 Tax=Gymnopilus junonius TaxID=109634 RepID=A0A9P5NWM2_GYMJU|nr:glycosyl hydrolase family 71-domain-containing protein [Gymnopilus junonius]
MSEATKPTKDSLSEANSLQLPRAFDFIRPPGRGLQGFQWTSNPEVSEVGEHSTQVAKRNYPYTINDWYQDIKLAASQNIDGFVLNVGAEDWQRQRCLDCFAASKRFPDSTNFQFFFSFDMTSIPGNSVDNIQVFRNYLSATYQSPRMFKHPRTNGVVVSTFSGENCTFGQGSMENGWAFLKSELNKIVPIYFIPAFFINPARYPNISALDGAFNASMRMPRSQIENAVLDSDTSHLENLKNGRTFMAAVSPWFFTHYGPDSWNKNWIYRSDDWLFVRRWEQLISMRDQIDMAQIISWNDYGESHYIGPVKGAQPNSQAWVDDRNYPPITKDRVFMWARPHPRDVTSCDHVARPNNWQLTDDTAWMVVFATAPATINVYTWDGSSAKQAFDIKAGVTKLSDMAVAVCNPVAYRFESRPGVFNFNAYVSMSP